VGRAGRRWAALAGAHLPYLDRLPASETLHYAAAGRRVALSALTAAAGWGLVAAYAAADLTPGPRAVIAVVAAVIAGLAVLDVDRDLVTGNGAVTTRAVLAAGNAVLIGEVILIALFAPAVAARVDLDRAAALDHDTTTAITTADTALEDLDTRAAELANPAEPAELTQARAERVDAVAEVTDYEDQVVELGRLRTQEATGIVAYDPDGNQLTTGRAGADGVATSSLDAELARIQDALDRARAEVTAIDTRITDLEAGIDQAGGVLADQLAAVADERVVVTGERDDAIARAEARATAPVGFLERVGALERAAHDNAVLLVPVWIVRIMLVAIELSVVDFAIRSRRRRIQLYATLLERIETRAADQLDTIAATLTIPTELVVPAVAQVTAPGGVPARAGTPPEPDTAPTVVDSAAIPDPGAGTDPDDPDPVVDATSGDDVGGSVGQAPPEPRPRTRRHLTTPLTHDGDLAVSFRREGNRILIIDPYDTTLDLSAPVAAPATTRPVPTHPAPTTALPASRPATDTNGDSTPPVARDLVTVHGGEAQVLGLAVTP
jgi:hypothetical protein